MDVSVSSTAPPTVTTGSNVGTPHAAARTPSTATIRRPPTVRKRHTWGAFQLVHAVILQQHGGISCMKIGKLLNAYFSTDMSTKTVHHRMNLESGVLPQSEAKKRTDQGQLSSSALWNKVKEYDDTSVEVGFVLFTHGLLNESEWTQISIEYRDSEMELELDTDAIMGYLGFLAIPDSTRTRTRTRIDSRIAQE